MEHLQYAVWLLGQAISALFYFWPISLILVAGFIVTLLVRSPFIGSGSTFHRRHLVVLSPLFVTLLIIILGTVMAHPSTSQSQAPSWPSYLVDAFLLIQLLVSIWVVWLMKGYRWFSVFTVGLEQWFGLACAFIAGMSVTGDWL
jgi:hypothetical protein